MNAKNKPEEFRKIVNEMADLYAKKNENYGDSFGETWRKLGPISACTRLSDKMNRACSLVTNKSESHFESLEDTFIDLACYAVMSVLEMRLEKEEKDETTGK